MVKVPVNGEECDAIEMDFQIHDESWNEYRLTDGTRVRTKSIVSRILRILDDEGSPAFNDEGDPLVYVRHRVEIVAVQGADYGC